MSVVSDSPQNGARVVDNVVGHWKRLDSVCVELDREDPYQPRGYPLPGKLVLVRNPDTGLEGYVVLREKITDRVWRFTETCVVRPIGWTPPAPTKPLITEAEWAALKAPVERTKRKRKARSVAA